MTPVPMSPVPRNVDVHIIDHDPYPTGAQGLVVEAWAQGYMVGSLIIMAFITLANMRRGKLLHWMILIELILGLWQGFWLFPGGSTGRWWLSGAAAPLNCSWFLHNVIAWKKIRPFLSPKWSVIFLVTVCLSFGYWILEIYANFVYFNGKSEMFKITRPLELLFRDPWWIISTVYLMYIIKTQYDLTLKEITINAPRFCVMVAAMILSIAFVILDVLAVTGALKITGTTGINPFWKLSFVFKCLTDTVILDDFKTALDRLRTYKLTHLGGSFSGARVSPYISNGSNLVSTWEATARDMRRASNSSLTTIPGANSKGDSEGGTNLPGFQTTLPKDQDPRPFTVSPELCSRFESFDLGHMVSSAIEDPATRPQTARTENNVYRQWPGGNGRREDEGDYADAVRAVSGPAPLEKAAAPSPLRQQL